MTEKICPVCNRPNISTAKRCWYCQSLLDDEPVEPGMQSEGEEAAEAVEGSDEVPEWLARIRQRKAIEEMQVTRSLSPEKAAPAEEPAVEPEEHLSNQPVSHEKETFEGEKSEPSQLPEWLQGLGVPPPTEGVTKSLKLEGKPEPENFSWLEKLQSWKDRDQDESEPGDEKTEPSVVQPSAESTNEEWLTEFLAPAGESGEAAPLQDLVAHEDISSEVVGPGEEKTKEPNSEEKTDDEIYDFSEETQPLVTEVHPLGPEFLDAEFSGSNSMQKTEPTSAPAEETPNILNESAPTDSSDLDWLAHYQEPEPEGPPEQALPSAPFLGVQSSDWGDAVSEPDIAPEEEAAEEEVEPAVLPTWMQNLRPIESISQGTAAPSEETVREGPLAGIEGALVGSSLDSVFEKPPMYTNKIQVTDRQNLRADLLQTLLAEPVEVYPAAEKQKSAKGKWLKRVIGLVFLAVILATLILAPGTSLLPVLFPPETANAYKLINELPTDRPVFVVADFEAGLSGEMGYASQALLEHLMLRNIPMAVLSTNPVGSSLMDEMLSKSQGLVNSYDAATLVLNFGYLAGSSIGMQGLTSDLRTAIPYDRDLAPAWTNPILEKVNGLQDLGALVVVTDDADTGRYWIEQVQSSLNGVPLILVTSAQAAPMIQPYYASGQVNGVVSGISGGSAYEQIMKLPGNSSYFFGAYQVLILTVVVLFLVGGFASLIKPAEKGSKG